MSKNQTNPADARAAGNKDALLGWVVMLLLVGVVLTAGYFYTH